MARHTTTSARSEQRFHLSTDRTHGGEGAIRNANRGARATLLPRHLFASDAGGAFGLLCSVSTIKTIGRVLHTRATGEIAMLADPVFWILVLPGLLLGAYARWRIKTNMVKYSQVRTLDGITGA